MATLTLPIDSVSSVNGGSDSGPSRTAQAPGAPVSQRIRRPADQPIAYLGRFIQRRSSLALARRVCRGRLSPGLGSWIRAFSFGDVSLCGETTPVSLPTLMLAYLLFSAGLGVKLPQLRQLLRDPKPLCAALVAGLAVPVAFLVVASQVVGGWLSADHAAILLVGLILLAAVPVAPTSTLWAQYANGNLALSLGLVLLSTLLSPARTFVVFQAGGHLAQGSCAPLLHEMDAHGAGALLIVAVLVPALLGLTGKVALGEARVAPTAPLLKVVGPVTFLVLTYANASAALPRVMADLDVGFLAVTSGVVAGLSLTTFAAGWGIARLLRADRDQQSALVFGLGMTNNSLAQVLASAVVVSHPFVIVPILMHTLAQQLIAGVAVLVFRRTARGGAVARVAVIA